MSALSVEAGSLRCGSAGRVGVGLVGVQLVVVAGACRTLSVFLLGRVCAASRSRSHGRGQHLQRGGKHSGLWSLEGKRASAGSAAKQSCAFVSSPAATRACGRLGGDRSREERRGLSVRLVTRHCLVQGRTAQWHAWGAGVQIGHSGLLWRLGTREMQGGGETLAFQLRAQILRLLAMNTQATDKEVFRDGGKTDTDNDFGVTTLEPNVVEPLWTSFRAKVRARKRGSQGGFDARVRPPRGRRLRFLQRQSIGQSISQPALREGRQPRELRCDKADGREKPKSKPPNVQISPPHAAARHHCCRAVATETKSQDPCCLLLCPLGAHM